MPGGGNGCGARVTEDWATKKKKASSDGKGSGKDGSTKVKGQGKGKSAGGARGGPVQQLADIPWKCHRCLRQNVGPARCPLCKREAPGWVWKSSTRYVGDLKKDAIATAAGGGGTDGKDKGKNKETDELAKLRAENAQLKANAAKQAGDVTGGAIEGETAGESTGTSKKAKAELDRLRKKITSLRQAIDACGSEDPEDVARYEGDIRKKLARIDELTAEVRSGHPIGTQIKNLDGRLAEAEKQYTELDASANAIAKEIYRLKGEMDSIGRASKAKKELAAELAQERLQLVRRQNEEKVKEAGGGEERGTPSGDAPKGDLDKIMQSPGFPPELLAGFRAWLSQQEAQHTPVPVDPPTGALVQAVPAPAGTAPAAGTAAGGSEAAADPGIAEAVAAAAKVLAKGDGDHEMANEEEDDPDAPGSKRRKQKQPAADRVA